MTLPGLTVAIPTFGRHEVLIETVAALLALATRPDELLILDQTPDHPKLVLAQLAKWDADGMIRWVRLPTPSITKAMNVALANAANDLVLFLDDDIIPGEELIAAHKNAHSQQPGGIVAGRVLQPWHKGKIDDADVPFRFNSSEARELFEFMGGNVSMPRQAAVTMGGFDENFAQVAYRFEADFALRWTRNGGQIRYEPGALIHHLKVPAGGTRIHGDHLRTMRPAHSVGEYYFLLKGKPTGWKKTLLARPFRAISTRHHLKRPWWIPATLVAEFLGLMWAFRLHMRGPSYTASHGKVGVANTAVLQMPGASGNSTNRGPEQSGDQ